MAGTFRRRRVVGKIIRGPPRAAHSGYPPQQQQQQQQQQHQPYPADDARRQFQDYPGGPSPQGQPQQLPPMHQGGYEDEVGPQITADIDSDEDEEIHHIDIRRDGHGFGFSIRGGAEYGAPLCVLRIAEEGAAERDGRLKVGDELLEINGNSTEGMLHSDAITIIKHGGDLVKLIVRRLTDDSNATEGKNFSHEQIPQGGPSSPTAASARDRYAQEYINSLGRARGGYR